MAFDFDHVQIVVSLVDAMGEMTSATFRIAALVESAITMRTGA